MIDEDGYIQLLTLQEKMCEIIKNPARAKANKELFLQYSNLISKSLFRPQIYMVNRVCILCGRESTESAEPMILLDCGHDLCSLQCLQVLIDNQLDGNLGKYDTLKCQCGQKISGQCVKTAFGGEVKFRKVLTEVCKKFEPKLDCPICGEKLPASDFITLECDHRFCVNCITMSIEILIQEGNVGNQIMCPDCQKVVDPHIIINLIDPETKEKYDDFLLRSLDAEPGTRYVCCIGKPGVNCKFSMFISVDREVVNCEVCGASFCPKCKNEPHPKMTCEQKKKFMNFSDPYLKSQLEAGIMKLCPWCNTPVMKDDACKYVVCIAEQCGGKTFFCWDCGIKLMSKHEPHPCVTKDVISNRFKAFFKKLWIF